MKQNKKQWIVEYSLTQNQYHIETIRNAQKANLEMLLNDKNPEYILLGGPFEKIEQASNFITEFESIFQLQENNVSSFNGKTSKK